MSFTDRMPHAAITALLMLAPVSMLAQTPLLPAVAQRPPTVDFSEGVQFEITPHTGMMGSSGTFGLRLGANYGVFQIELAGEQVIGRTANLYPISANGILNLSTRGRLIPYGSVGAGLLLTVPTNAIGDRTVSTLGVNFGGGVRYFLTSVFGFRAEVKQYMTSVAHSTEPGSKLLVFQEWTLGAVFLVR